MSKSNISMLKRYNLIDPYEFEHDTPDRNTATRAHKQSPFPQVEDVLAELEEAFDLRGLVA